MHQQLLPQQAAQPLRVYAIWVPMYGNEGREDWEQQLLDDPRVTHFWDGELITARWFAQHLDTPCCGEVAWDIYYLFPAEAVWQTTPTPLIHSGVTVYRQRQQLETEVQALSSQ